MRLPLLAIVGILSCLTGTSQIQINGSYLNVSRPSGGPVSPGDILELRAVISIPSGTTVTGLYYTDNVPAGTSFISGSLKVVTNENQVIVAIPNTGNYTDASGDDRGQIAGSAITIYMGAGASSSAGGAVVGGTTPPVFYSTATILMVGYQVQVTAGLGAVITTAGVFHYLNAGSHAVNVPVTNLGVSQYYGCSSTGATNLVTAETNGTFGTGTTQNRSTSSALVVGYTFTNLTANAPVDGQYSIVKNTSPTQYTGATPSSSQRVFGVWDVMGDHTGTATTAGNAPAANGVAKGYLLAVNATFTPASVFTTTITGLTANNTYTIGLWLRNICGSCANNPLDGTSLTTPGVKPNVAIDLNGNNYYSTGDITYSGQWIQKSFTFQNGASTSAVLEIKNNAPGGGGNDWVMDDITMKQCLIVLPLGLQSFSGRSTARGITLDWQVDPWPELQSFVVERSTDGSHFLPVGQAEAFQDITQYQFTDALLPSAGASLYYRIRMVNNDGSTDYSKTVAVNTGNGPAVLTTRLAPNPARTTTTLAIWSPHSGSALISLWSPAGSLVHSRQVTITEGTNTVELSLGRLPTGIYIVRTTTGGASAISRLIVE
jgi:uncharacterized repeat protein (TIGR01451 family)